MKIVQKAQQTNEYQKHSYTNLYSIHIVQLIY